MYENDEIMEEKDYGMLYYMIKLFLKQKVFVLIVLLISTLVIAIAMLVFAHNTSKYFTQFELDFIGIEDKKYPDGSYFNYSNIISAERINQVKNSNAAFGSLDTNAMLDGGCIKISENFKYAADKITRIKSFYEITIYSKLFTGVEQAEAFFNELLKIELEKILSSSSILPRYLKAPFIGESTEYYNTAILLQKQYFKLLEYYQNMLDEYSINGLLSGENIYLRMKEITDCFSDAVILDSYVLEIVQDGYIKNAPHYETLLLSELNVLEKKRDLNARIILNLQDAGKSIESANLLSGVLAEHLITQESILHDMEIKSRLLEMCQNKGSNVNADFENRFNKSIETLNGFCDKYEKLYLDVVSQRTAIQYLNNLVVLKEELVPLFSIPFFTLAISLTITAFALYARTRLQEERQNIAEATRENTKKK